MRLHDCIVPIGLTEAIRWPTSFPEWKANIALYQAKIINSMRLMHSMPVSVNVDISQGMGSNVRTRVQFTTPQNRRKTLELALMDTDDVVSAIVHFNAGC